MNIGNEILYLAPHADDEVSGAGTLSKMIENGRNISLMVFSYAEISIPDGYPPNVLHIELEKSMKILGISNLISKDFPTRRFPEYRQEILEDLVSLRKLINPDVVFVPSTYDIHQDHQTITQEAIRAFDCTILGYEVPHKVMPSDHLCYIKMTSRHLEKKMQVINCYESQDFRGAWDEEMIRGLARIRGRQIHGLYAEAFEVIRMVGDI